MNPPATQDVTVLDLPFFSVEVNDITLGSEVARLLEQDHTLPGVIVISGGQFRGLVSRNQFFQRLGRPFGIEVYSTRPITAFLDSLPTPPLQVSKETTIQNAAIICLARPVEYVYDPFVITMKDHPPRLVDGLMLQRPAADGARLAAAPDQHPGRRLARGRALHRQQGDDGQGLARGNTLKRHRRPIAHGAPAAARSARS